MRRWRRAKKVVESSNIAQKGGLLEAVRYDSWGWCKKVPLYMTTNRPLFWDDIRKLQIHRYMLNVTGILGLSGLKIAASSKCFTE